IGIKNDDSHLALDGSFYWTDHLLAVLGREDEAVKAHAHLLIDEVDLLGGVGFLARPVPENLDGFAGFLFEVLRGSLRAALDGLPVLVSESLGNDGDAVAVGRRITAAAAVLRG